MSELKDKSIFAREKLENKSYRERIDKLQEELHELRIKLAEAEKTALQERGYKPINIEGTTIMVPVGMSLRQLRVSMQQMPVPEEDRDRVVKYLVEDEDKRSVRESSDYQEVVDERRKLIDSIMSVYKDFWNDEVSPNSETDEERIVYMMAGLDKNIRSRKLSNIIDVEKNKCKSYYLEDGVVHHEK